MHHKKYLSGIWVGAAALLLAGCGSSYNASNNTNNNKNLTGIKKRVLLSNITTITGQVQIIDAQKNVPSSVTVSATQPSKMLTAGGQTVILDSTTSQITLWNNGTETLNGAAALQDQPFDIAISPDGKTAYAAIKNMGVVEVVNTSSANVVATAPVPSVSRLVEGPGGHKLLAFSDDPQTLGSTNANAFFVIDTSTNTATAIPMPVGSQPFTAIFDPSDANDTTAFILNCAAECGGNSGSPSFTPTAPNVTKVGFSNPATPVLSTPVPVSGATVGLLSGTNLFVAGTPTTPPAGCTLAACGIVQVVNTGSLTAGAPVNITDGLHQVMALTSNKRLYIGAAHCSVGAISPQNTVQGCLSIFDTGGSTVSVPPESSFRQNFDVTGLQPISNINTIYVVQGGELDIFDINTSLPSTSITPLDVSGRAIDVLQIDP